MKLGDIKYILLTCTLIAESAVAIKPPAPDEPPDGKLVEQVAGDLNADWSSFPEDPSELVGKLLKAEALILSERLSGEGATVFRVNKKIEGVGEGSGSEIPAYIEIREFGGTWFAREIPPTEVARLAAEGKLSEDGLTAEEFADGLRAGAAGALVLGAGIESKIGMTAKGLYQELDVGMDSYEGKEAIKSVANPKSGRYGDCIKPPPPFDPNGEISYSDPFNFHRFMTRERPGGVSTSPALLMAGNACFLLFAADAFDAAQSLTEEEKEAAAEASTEYFARALKEMHYIGKEDVRGHPSHGVGTDNAGISETVDDQKVEINQMNVWIDEKTFVRRKMRFEGIVTSNGKPQDFCMERIYDDYRNVPNSKLYEPYQEIISICVPLTPQQQKELQKAEAELADYETQLAQVPPSQQAMMKRMIEPQIERMRALASGNTAEIEIITTSIEIGPEFGGPDTSPIVADQVANDLAQIEAEAEALQAARRACLEQKMAEPGQARRDGSDAVELAGAAKRTALSVVSGDISGLVAGFFMSGQTKDDISAIAEALGLSEDDVADCKNP